MDRWSGRVALVTGASAGIGAAICKALVLSGMRVVGAARGIDKIQELANELSGTKGSLTAVKCDLSKDEEIYNLFQTIKKNFGGVDLCINNAGMSFYKSLLEGTPDEWRTMMDLNVIALCLCTKLAVESMKERRVDDGHIININSVCGHVVVAAQHLHFYTATKFAVTAISEGLRQEMRASKSRIRVTSISPGIVDTPFIENMTQNREMVKQLTAGIECLTADDIADTVLHAVAAPPHVEINEIIIRPTEQDF